MDKDTATHSTKPLSVYFRFYMYALHGLLTEICFTALWEFVVSRHFTFHGQTSIWVVPIYGFCGLIQEQVYLRLHARKYSLPIRILCYTMVTYVWEFSTGFVLKQFNACPWDYTPFHGDFLGLITLEYAPLWALGNFFCDQFLIPYTRQLYWGMSIDDAGFVIGLGAQKKTF